MSPEEQRFVTGPDCTDCGCGLPALAPPISVTQPRPKRVLSRRSTFAVAAQAGALSLLAACSPRSTSSAASQQAASSASNGSRGAALQRVDLAFCSQLLCVLPYEVARQRGFFEAEGLYVNLVYMQGGAQAMNALVTNKLDWVGTPMDLVVQAVAHGTPVRMLVSTARLPFFALVTSPRSSGVADVTALAGKTIGIAGRGTTDDLLARYLLSRSGVNPDQVQWAELGPNLYDAMLQNRVDAGMVQEPSLTLLQAAGAKALVNLMSLKDAQKWLGSAYQFMGLNTRADVLEKKADVAAKLVRALIKANRWVLGSPGSTVVEAAPPEIVSGGHVQLFANAINRYKTDLYPADGRLDADAVQRVIDVQQSSGALDATSSPSANDLFTNRLIPA